MFLKFANFYYRFIQCLSRIAALLTSMLRTINGPAANKLISVDNIKEINYYKKMEKNNYKASGTGFITLGAKFDIFELRQVFGTVLIFYHFDLKWHIQLGTDVLDYAMSEILRQSIFEDLGWWHPMPFFFQKLIPVEIQYNI